MNTTLPQAATWDEIPKGTQWPSPDTMVLLRRDLRPGTDLSRMSRFADDRWDMDPAIFEDHAKARSLNFAPIPQPLRREAKYYIWQLLNHTEPVTIRRANGGRPSILSVVQTFSPFKAFLSWLDSQAVTAFARVTHHMLDDYLADLAEQELSVGRKYDRVVEVRRLWAFRDVLPERLRLPSSPPWGGEDSRELFGSVHGGRENRTPRIQERTMQQLLRWAIRFIEDWAEDILAAHAEHVELHENDPHERRLVGGGPPPRGEIHQRMTAYLARLRESGGALPGTLGEGGSYTIDWRHVGIILGCQDSVRRTASGRMAIESGIPIADDAYLDTPITGLLDDKPWRERSITYREGPKLARLLSTASFIICSYLSGARPGEVLNLRRGCVEYDADNDLWLVRGRYYKNAVDADGNKLPDGELRRDPWVVVEIVARAIDVLERLHPHSLLFSTWLEPYRRRQTLKRQGSARTDDSIALDLAAFVHWVNEECRSRGRTDGIPADQSGPLAPSRFRRTLAWFIRRRPRGLVAASIQYGHVHTRLLQGYAGSYESGFPDEYAFEDWLFRLENIAEDQQSLDAGEHVSGPAAEAYRHRVTEADHQFAGHVLTTTKQARDLIGNPLLQIHHGQGMTCVLNPVHAACQLRGTADDPLVTPDTDDCRPKCRNLARTDRDILHIQQQHDALAEIVADPLAPAIRHERDQHELQRLHAILNAHEQTKKDTTP